MHYEGNMMRPPYEANSILLQVAVGCAHNECTFCGAYAGQQFKIKSDDIILADIQYAARHFRNHDRLFLCDGDAMMIPYPRLLKIFQDINEYLPNVKEIATFASARSINRRTDEEIRELNDLGLAMIYMGLESGDNETLAQVRKGSSVELIIEAGRKIRKTRILLALTAIVGLAGRERSQIHAQKTGEAISAIEPHFVGATSLLLMPGTALHEKYVNKEFSLLNPLEVLEEVRAMICHTNASKVLFSTAHASNYLNFSAWLPEQKQAALDYIDKAMNGDVKIKPEFMRAF